MEWLNDIIKDVPSKKKFYLFIKLFLFKWKGLRYKEMYLILKTLYKTKQIDEEIANKKAFEEIVRIYYYNNNKSYPKGLNNE